MANDDEPTVYSVRPSDRAAAQIEAEHKRQEERLGFTKADAWEDALMDAVASLATYPKRRPVALENGIFQKVSPGQTLRQLIFKPTRGSAGWRILFTIHEADENDPPTIRVQRILHGAQAPMTEWPSEEE